MAASLTFAEVNRYSDDFAAYLRRTSFGAKRQGRGSIPNGLPYPMSHSAFSKRLCARDVNPLYTAHEMIQLFRDAEPAAIVGINMFADKLPVPWSKSPSRM